MHARHRRVTCLWPLTWIVLMIAITFPYVSNGATPAPSSPPPTLKPVTPTVAPTPTPSPTDSPAGATAVNIFAKSVTVYDAAWEVTSVAGRRIVTLDEISSDFYQITDVKISGDANGVASDSQFYYPSGICFSNGTLYIADRLNQRIRAIKGVGVNNQYAQVTTIAGSVRGYRDGPGDVALFNNPTAIDVDASGYLYVADSHNHRIRKISPSGVVTTLAGGTQGFADLTGSLAQFNYPIGISATPDGTVYVADTNNHRIRKVEKSGAVSTLAGSSAGVKDSFGQYAKFHNPTGVDVLASSGDIYVADSGNHLIRRISKNGDVITLAGRGTLGNIDHGSALSAAFNLPFDVAVDSARNVYVSDKANNKIRRISPSGKVTTVGGNVPRYHDGATSTSSFNMPSGIVIDSDQPWIIYIADEYNSVIRKAQFVAVSNGDPAPAPAPPATPKSRVPSVAKAPPCNSHWGVCGKDRLCMSGTTICATSKIGCFRNDTCVCDTRFEWMPCRSSVPGAASVIYPSFSLLALLFFSLYFICHHLDSGRTVAEVDEDCDSQPPSSLSQCKYFHKYNEE